MILLCVHVCRIFSVTFMIHACVHVWRVFLCDVHVCSCVVCLVVCVV